MKNLVHRKQELGMTWCVTDFGQGGAKGGGFVPLHSCLLEKKGK